MPNDPLSIGTIIALAGGAMALAQVLAQIVRAMIDKLVVSRNGKGNSELQDIRSTQSVLIRQADKIERDLAVLLDRSSRT